MNGRRIRGVRPSKIHQINKMIQDINDNIAHTHRILSKLDRVLLPDDYLGDRIEDRFCYNTWRTVGVLNLTDHFLVRYMERVENIFISDIDLMKRFGYYNINESDEMKIRYFEYENYFDDVRKERIREFIKNPPEQYTVIRQDERVITILS